jgi:uncharacterized LabA/DUF88 family protein
MAGRWDERRRTVIESLDVDVWLFTEVSEHTNLPDFHSIWTEGEMAAQRRWAAVFAREHLHALPQPHPATAAACLAGLTLWSSILPWRTATAEHDTVAEIANVKLRLGQLVNRGGGFTQKGVDSRIVLDLSTLALRGSALTIFLLAGDEDLVEGVRAAQDAGARVILITVRSQRTSPSRLLSNEADENLDLSRAELQPFFTSFTDRPEAPLGGLAFEETETEDIKQGNDRSSDAETSSSTDQDWAEPGSNDIPLTANMSDAVDEVGLSFGKEYFQAHSIEEVDAVLSGPPHVAVPIRAELIGFASQKGVDVSNLAARERLVLGFLRGLQLRRDARATARPQ